MAESIKNMNAVKKIRKTMLYSLIRQFFPMPELRYVDDRNLLDEAKIVRIDWPSSVRKPFCGIVQDYGKYPKWSKYCRFLANNEFEYDLYDLHRHDWMVQARRFDVIIGIPSNSVFHLQEMRSKYSVLETLLGKECYPTATHAFLYEDKFLEAYISQATGIPFVNTYISHRKDDAIHLVMSLKYPFISKVVPSSGSYGVELVRTPKQGREIVNQAFSRNGRRTHVVYSRQKNYVYFQEYIPNDGYDIRVVLVGNWVSGYYRRVLEGDFRASGMETKEKRQLPEESIRIAQKVNGIIRSPLLAVDMVRGLDGKYYIIEFSPHYLMGYSDELCVNGTPGIYVLDLDGTYHFEQGRYWVAELALREFLLNHYLPKISRSHDEQTSIIPVGDTCLETNRNP